MKNTLRIIINAYFKAINTRCSDKTISRKLPQRAILKYLKTPYILGAKPVKGLNFRSSFEGHSLSANSLHGPKESLVDKVVGTFVFICFLALVFMALGV